MRKSRLACILAVLVLVCVSVPAQEGEPPKGPSVVKITGEGVVAQLTFEKGGGKISVTSKGAPLKPGTYWLKALSLFKKDAKGRSWELRCTGVFGSLANITIDAGQQKVLLLGEPLHILVEAKLNKDSPGSISIRAGGAGENGDQYAPGAYLDGKTLVLPTVTVKDAEGKTLTTGQITLGVDKTYRFDFRFPSGYKGKYDVDIQPVMGPFEYKVSKSIEPLP